MSSTEGNETVAPAAAEGEPAGRAAPIQSRFLFVDVAAQRAKQLRRGARAKLPAAGVIKFERIAMEEIREGLIDYELPEWVSGHLKGAV